MAVYDSKRGFDRVIHNIENAPFRTKFDGDIGEMEGNLGIGCISDNEPQPLLVRSIWEICNHYSWKDQQHGMN